MDTQPVPQPTSAGKRRAPRRRREPKAGPPGAGLATGAASLVLLENKAFEAGFYGQHFTPREIADLQNHQSPGLADEIEMVRVMLRRLFDQAMLAELNLDERVSVLDRLSIGATRLATLLYTHYKITGDVQALDELALQLALREVGQELGLH
jgi:hypothetical protein